MRHTRGRVVDVDDLDDFDRRMAAGAHDLGGWRVRSLDLRERGDRLRSCRVAGAMFLGCTFGEGVEPDLEARGAVVFPALPDVPLDVYRGDLYTAGELYGDGSYAASAAARAYAWTQSGLDADGLLAATLHDHAIDRALAEWVEGRSVVGVMGGHAVSRGSAEYADAGRLGRLLGSRHTVATGGGPGAMEAAANLGARLAREDEQAVARVVAAVAEVPDYWHDVGAWAQVGLRALRHVDSSTDTLGIPTWHYGHEPPTVFASAIAKYVRNAVREAVLLEICDGGIVFLPGAAGTVQEVFQDACENFYADPSSLAPMAKRVLAKKDACSAPLRRTVVYLLGNSGDNDAPAILRDVALNDPEPEVRSTAIQYLARSPSDIAVNTLDEVLRTSTDPSVQRSAARALAANPSPRARQAVRSLIERADAPERLRIEAVSGFEDSQRTTDEDAAYLRSVYTKIDNPRVKARIARVIGQLGGDANDQWLLGLMRNNDEPLEVRTAALSRVASRKMPIGDAVKLYGSVADREMRQQLINIYGQRTEPEATDKLLDIVKNDTDYNLRRQAIGALQRKNDPRATKLLLELIDK